MSERSDLRPMAMVVRDVRPGMVLLTQTIGAPVRKTISAVVVKDDGRRVALPCTDGDTLALGLGDVTQILGEDVLADELAVGDVVRYPGGWFVLEPDQRAALTAALTELPGHFPGTWTRAYVDPAWELEQARSAH